MIKKYYKEIYIYIKKSVFDRDLAEDITQEAFARVIKKADSKNIENERALLYRIAKNIMVDLYREKNRIDKIAFNEEEFFQEENTIENQIIEAEQRSQLMEEIDKLPKKRRQAFTLHMIDGYSRQEVAEIMNISFNAVEQHIARASNQLKENLSKNEEESFE
ncbi:RNA polymerase sigma factor [Halarcobacter mediterraneus]|uniref:RNA polymerase sigma factor n=1 Tax=Halarcobacter mediterraneus TaxID=2023153 RepID=UPI0019D6FFD2|nr:RNA polymerase sigma factor [Halarcobacter mediterraneus]